MSHRSRAARSGWHARLWRALAGDDGATRSGLPWAEALAPLTLASLVVLVVNDRVLKPAIGAQAGWLTGKLSDVAGLVAAPLVATAVVDVLLWAIAKLGWPIDWTLRRWKLLVAIAVAAAGVCAVKLSAGGAAAMEDALRALGFDAHVVADPTDLLALPALGLAWWQGTRAIARGAHGRAAWVMARFRRGWPTPRPFADAIACGADREAVAAVERAVDAWLRVGDPAEVDRALARLRGLPR